MSYQREFSHRLRAGLVGIGSHAYRNILPVMNFLPVQLVAVCNRRHRHLCRKSGWIQLHTIGQRRRGVGIQMDVLPSKRRQLLPAALRRHLDKQQNI